MSQDAPSTRPLHDWAEVLGTLEQAINQWLARAAEPPPESEPRLTTTVPLQLFEERLDRLQVYLDQAEQKAEEALAPLTAEIEALGRWREKLNTIRGNLVERTVRAV